MAETANSILNKMLERLYASLVQGPCLNCRPHSSRQRVDLMALDALQHIAPGEIIARLLAGARKVEILAKVPPFLSAAEDEELSETERATRLTWENQVRLLGKLRDIAADARDYEQETGENALYLGYPLLSIPPGADALGESTARVLAPLALIPVEMIVKRGATPSLTLMGKGAGVDVVIANFPLLAWLEQQTGGDTSNLFGDEDGSQPWREFNEIGKLLAEGLRLPVPPEFNAERALEPVPRGEQLSRDPAFLNAAVLGLFPVSNQGLLRDMKAMIQGEDLSGPIENFLAARAATENPLATPAPATPATPAKSVRKFSAERLVTDADPCQARAVRRAREGSTLVIHGPPGTGKSQTITNIMGDHLARGERVLLVCDKRTALDVVQNRMEHLGLGDFCAVVHDPQRDQRSLYLKIRDRLENLVDQKSDPGAELRLRETDDELQRLHAELTGYFSALGQPPATRLLAFHDLVGDWLSIDSPPGVSLDENQLAAATAPELDAARPAIREVLERGRASDYPHNPWAPAAGLELGEFLSRPAAEFRQRLASLERATAPLDATWTEGQPPLAAGDLRAQALNRQTLAKLLTEIEAMALPAAQKTWFDKGPAALRQTLSELASLDPFISLVSDAPLDAELRSTVVAKPPGLAEINQAAAVLAQYEGSARTWYGFLFSARKAAAAKVTSAYGLTVSLPASERLQKFFRGLKARVICQDFIQREFGVGAAAPGLMSDSDLLSGLSRHRLLLSALGELHATGSPLLTSFLAQALAGATQPAIERLKASAARAVALATFLADAERSGLFSRTWLAEMDAQWRTGVAAAAPFAELAEKFVTLEDILRLRLASEKIPASLREAVGGLLPQPGDPEARIEALRKALLAKEISARIRGNPLLQQIDQERMDRCFQRYRQLEATKRTLVRDTILHQWVSRQKSRLLAGTETQLNSDGTALKRRLLTRGERAMKLRQMILTGAQASPPDPLFDMCPIWMASPGTVAQIFPRQAVFDVVVFDEASQCRLEEALPVLIRGRRIVIAGDPKQLPPTRFFETTLTESETEDAETEQDLFEQQQGETEDLLGAALNIEVEQCYLDVHYRSRDEALIGFSNQSFYQGRLQPIPGHPSQRARSSPIRLIRADGIYEKRGNLKEAQLVCEVVAELLARPDPPSIGIACFNLTQRDVILDALDQCCEKDPQFSQRLDQARTRRGHGSFEGLFVKNLENVQGDERDHIIISTTFGVDAAGKFRRNFGPVGQTGGGRRLNVLVTRAREMIHLITSIPAAEYSALPKMDSSQTPAGRWLLYAYLNYAQRLAAFFSEEAQHRAQAEISGPPNVHLGDEPPASRLAVGLANHLRTAQALSSDVPWGNEGFCVDIAIHHPTRAREVTIGVLCDMTRFEQAEDPVEWDLFRTSTLERQGWRFHRIWSPALYSDPARHQRLIAEASRKFAAESAKQAVEKL